MPDAVPPNQRLHLSRAPYGEVALDSLQSWSLLGPVPQSGAVVAAQVKRISVRRREGLVLMCILSEGLRPLAVSACWGFLLFLGCSKEQRTNLERTSEGTVQVEPGAAQLRDVIVQRTFEQTERERLVIDSTLLEVQARYYPIDSPLLVGQVDRFTRDSTSGRYLLMALVPEPTPEDPHKTFIKFFAFGWELPGLSEPFDMRIEDDAIRFAPTKIADFDNDGLADLSFCWWQGDYGTTGDSYVIGYRDGKWYFVTRPAHPPPECGPLPEP